MKTNATSSPNKEWIHIAKTAHAKGKIKAYFSKQEKENYIETGKTILLSELRKKKLAFENVFTPENLKRLNEELKIENLDDLYFLVGSLRYTATYLISFLMEEKKDVQDILLERVQRKSTMPKQDHESEILVDGNSDILVTLAKCCRPIYGEEIVGFVTKGEGVTVHKVGCPNISTNEERRIDVSWNVNNENFYFASFLVTVPSGKNYLADLISKSSEQNIFVESVQSKEKEDNTIYEMVVKVKNKEMLERYMDQLKSFSYVKDVKRI